MTVPVQSSSAQASAIDLVLGAAQAAAEALPVGSPVSCGAPVAGLGDVPLGESVTVAADLTGELTGTLVVVVGPDVLAALQSGPLGPLDPVAGLQPTLDAAAAALGVQVGPTRLVDAAEERSLRLHRATSVALHAGDGHVATLAAVLPSAPSPVAAAAQPSRGLELLHDVQMQVTGEIGRTQMTVRELLALTPGTVVELDRAAGSPADLRVNGSLLARGEIVVVDEDFGIRITEIVRGGFDAAGQPGTGVAGGSD